MLALTLWMKLCVFNLLFKSNLCELILDQPLDQPVDRPRTGSNNIQTRPPFQDDPFLPGGDVGIIRPGGGGQPSAIRPPQFGISGTGGRPRSLPRIIRTCPPLSPPSNGVVTVTPIDERGREAMARYSCEREFMLSDSDERVCMAGVWRGQEPICFLPVECPTLSPTPNGSINLTAFDAEDFSASVKYKCDDNFKIVGEADRICRFGIWEGDGRACEPIITPLAQPVALGGFMNPLSASCVPNNNDIVANLSLEECAQACVLEPRCRSFEFARNGTEVLTLRGGRATLVETCPCHLQFATAPLMKYRCQDQDYYERIPVFCNIPVPVNGSIIRNVTIFNAPDTLVLSPGPLSFECPFGFRFSEEKFRMLKPLTAADKRLRMSDRPFDTMCSPTKDGLSAIVEGGIPTGCEPYCLVYAPNNATVGNRRRMVELAMGATVAVQCDPGFRLALPSGGFAPQRVFTCDYATHRARGDTEERIKNTWKFRTDAATIVDESGLKIGYNICEPFCSAVPKKFTILATHTKQQDVSVGQVVIFQCASGTVFPNGRTEQRVTCDVGAVGRSMMRLESFVETCTPPKAAAVAKVVVLWIALFVMVAAAVGTAVSKVVHRRRDDVGSLLILGMAFNTIDVLTDMAFVFEQYELQSVFRHFSAIFLAVPIAINAALMFKIVAREMQIDEFRRFFNTGNNRFFAIAVMVFASMRVDALLLISSRIVSALSFPLSRSGSEQAQIFGLAGNLLEDVPQLVIQAIVISSKPTFVALISVVSSSLAVVFSLISRLLVLLSVNAEAKSKGEDSHSPRDPIFPSIRRKSSSKIDDFYFPNVRIPSSRPPRPPLLQSVSTPNVFGRENVRLPDFL
eukprot:184706_1